MCYLEILYSQKLMVCYLIYLWRLTLIRTLWLTFKNLIHSTIDELVPLNLFPLLSTSHGLLAHLNDCVVLSNVNIIKQDILIPRNIGIVLRHSRSKFSLNVRRLTSSMFVVFKMIIKVLEVY